MRIVTFRSSRLRKSSTLFVVKRLQWPFSRWETSGWAIPSREEISRCLSFVFLRSAKTLPEPSSHSVCLWFFLLILCQIIGVLDDRKLRKAVRRAILDGLEDPEDTVRTEAIFALARTGTPDDSGALGGLLADDALALRVEAAGAMLAIARGT